MLLLAIFLGLSSSAVADSTADTRVRALDLAYNLDRDEALSLMRRSLEARPDDAFLHRGLASLVWLEILFRRGAVSVDDLLGSVSPRPLALPVPPPLLAAEFERHARRARELARTRLRTHPRDVGALYELGAAEGLLASYIATVQGRVLDALGEARGAFDAHERVLALAADRKDAGLVVGTYRYVVASLPLPVRMLAYLVGFGGDKARGLALIEQAAEHPGDARPEALFALTVLYNRDGRYDAALGVLERLRALYPRNRLLWLEAGATALRADRVDLANQRLAEGARRLAEDRRARSFGEDALWAHKRGVALARAGRRAEAAPLLLASLRGEARNWVRGRSYLELGGIAARAGRREEARAHLSEAIRLCAADNDRASARQARARLAEVQP